MKPSFRFMTRARARTLAMCLTAVPASVGCGAKVLDMTSTDTGNPPLVDLGKLSSDTEGGTVTVTGEKGAASPGGSVVTVTNQRTGKSVSVKANADGSFTLKIAGAPGDTLEIKVAGGEHTELLLVGAADAGTNPDDSGVPPPTTQVPTATSPVGTALSTAAMPSAGSTTADPMATAVTTTTPNTTAGPVTTSPILEAPVQHRASRETCDDVRPAERPSPDGQPSDPADGGGQLTCEDGQFGTCCFDEDCSEGTRGRCTRSRDFTYCTYDACQEDSDCATGGPCACSEGGNQCLGGNCQVDSDCSGGALCSPSFGPCGSYSGVIAYYCHTPDDECTNDTDCSDPDEAAGYCMYSSEVGHWLCSYTWCAG
jgi:hypothetical protein